MMRPRPDASASGIQCFKFRCPPIGTTCWRTSRELLHHWQAQDAPGGLCPWTWVHGHRDTLEQGSHKERSKDREGHIPVQLKPPRWHPVASCGTGSLSTVSMKLTTMIRLYANAMFKGGGRAGPSHWRQQIHCAYGRRCGTIGTNFHLAQKPHYPTNAPRPSSSLPQQTEPTMCECTTVPTCPNLYPPPTSVQQPWLPTPCMQRCERGVHCQCMHVWLEKHHKILTQQISAAAVTAAFASPWLATSACARAQASN